LNLYPVLVGDTRLLLTSWHMATGNEIKLPLTSPDVNLERLDRLREIFPEAFTEGKIDFERLRQFLGKEVADAVERYGLSWAGKSEAIKNIQTLTTGTLLPVPNESVNFDATENLFIEGDNLEVLKLLQGGYHGRIKMIYIDPPYNTGGEFIYPDNYKEGLADYLKFSGQVSSEGVKLTTNPETDGRYHSRWLTMMYPRLFLARNLLREDGVVFVSIDDHEVHNLRAIIDEIFGEENFIQEFVWKRHSGGGNDSKFAAVDHEYVLCCARNKAAIANLRLPLSDEDRKQYDGKDKYFETLGSFKTKSFCRMRPDDPRPGLEYDIKAPDGTILRDTWKWEESRFLEALKDEKVIIRRDRNGKWQVEYKIYLYNGRDDDEQDEKTKVPRSLLVDVERNSEGKKQLSEVLGEDNIFNNPKPTGLIKYLAQFATNKDSIILDFFAGSGTTAQAILELNAQDGGNRKFIIVQLPEPTDLKDFPTIAEITKERVRRAVKKLNERDNGKLLMEKNQDRGFKVFKLSSSNFKVWDDTTASKDGTALAEQLKLMAHNVIENRADDALLYELILKSNRPLTDEIENIKIGKQIFYNVANGTLAICLERKLTQETLRGIIARKPKSVICLDIAFAGNDQLKTNIVLEMKSHGIEFHTA
jgi:adenine-specific DNA-methyltransferase